MEYVAIILFVLLLIIFAWGWYNKVQLRNVLEMNYRQVRNNEKAVALEVKTFLRALWQKIAFWRK